MTSPTTPNAAEWGHNRPTFPFAIDLYLNVTTVADARAAGDDGVADLDGRDTSPAIFCRFGFGARHRAGDRLRFVERFDVVATSALYAAEVGFAIGNLDADRHPDAEVYRSHHVRSVSVGDVVVVHTPDGPAAYAVESFGFGVVDLGSFVIEGGR